MAENTRLIKSGEAAEYLMVSPQTLRVWHSNKTLVPVIVRGSGHRLYSIQQLQEFKAKYMGGNE